MISSMCQIKYGKNIAHDFYIDNDIAAKNLVIIFNYLLKKHHS